MKVHHEKRKSERHDHGASIVYAFHNSDKFYNARMCNFSNGGLCFESSVAIEPGSDIYVMMEEFVPDTIGSEIYDGYLAEVRWCQELPEVDPALYHVGVKYYRTMIAQHLEADD
ncbi:MAG: PilZ domain-containing protein [Desulfobacterales bacterium]|nr:MAG: PilZ domain-containing protein [Desulfobacterales bacterium]